MKRFIVRAGTLLLITLAACSDTEGFGSQTLAGAPGDIVCVCSGLPGRLGMSCPTQPRNGNIRIQVRCDPARANGVGLRGEPRCRGSVTTDSGGFVVIGPQNLIDIPADQQVYELEFQTSTFMVGPAGFETNVFIPYFLNGAMERIPLGVLRVSNNCPF